SPEWARPYLESLQTPEVTLERMRTIAMGQHAQEAVARAQAHRDGLPFVILDTDLLSTIGYLELYFGEQQRSWGSPRNSDYWALRDQLDQMFDPADLYLVTDDTLPFAPDPLRYGGDRRETTREYWIALLQRYGCRYKL